MRNYLIRTPIKVGDEIKTEGVVSLKAKHGDPLVERGTLAFIDGEEDQPDEDLEETPVKSGKKAR